MRKTGLLFTIIQKNGHTAREESDGRAIVIIKLKTYPKTQRYSQVFADFVS
jgi:hypothetical protein